MAVERDCSRYLKNSYNACKVSLGSQAKMVSKCNRIASLVILNYKIFLGEVPQNPPLVLHPPPPLCRRRSVITNAVRWPYHFLKADNGPGVFTVCKDKINLYIKNTMYNFLGEILTSDPSIYMMDHLVCIKVYGKFHWSKIAALCP